MSEVVDVIAALRVAHESLAGFGATLSADELALPSVATGWSIGDVFEHLGDGAQASRQQLLAAWGGPANVFADGPQGRVGDDSQFAAYSRAMGNLFDTYGRLSSRELSSLRVNVGFLPYPVDIASAARLRLSEVALHAWDVHAAFEPAAALLSSSVDVLLHGEPDLTSWLGRAEGLGGVRSIVDVETSDPSSTFRLVLDNAVSVTFDEISPAPGVESGTLRIPAESWLRLVSGRLGQDHTPSSVTVTGATTLDLLRRVFVGY